MTHRKTKFLDLEENHNKTVFYNFTRMTYQQISQIATDAKKIISNVLIISLYGLQMITFHKIFLS